MTTNGYHPVRVNTHWVKIFMAGDMETARQVCRSYTYRVGLCVTLAETDYIYTGGAESGFVIGLINYPRFPTELDKLVELATSLAEELLEANSQHSYTIMTPKETIWYSRREHENL